MTASATEVTAPQSGPINNIMDSHVKRASATFPVLTGDTDPAPRMPSVRGRTTRQIILIRNAFLTERSLVVACAGGGWHPLCRTRIGRADNEPRTPGAGGK